MNNYYLGQPQFFNPLQIEINIPNADEKEPEFAVEQPEGILHERKRHSRIQWPSSKIKRLLDLHEKLGNKWSLISDMLREPERLVKNQFYSFLRQVAKKIKTNDLDYLKNSTSIELANISYVCSLLKTKAQNREMLYHHKRGGRRTKNNYVGKIIISCHLKSQIIQDYEDLVSMVRKEANDSNIQTENNFYLPSLSEVESTLKSQSSNTCDNKQSNSFIAEQSAPGTNSQNLQVRKEEKVREREALFGINNLKNNEVVHSETIVSKTLKLPSIPSNLFASHSNLLNASYQLRPPLLSQKYYFSGQPPVPMIQNPFYNYNNMSLSQPICNFRPYIKMVAPIYLINKLN